jgi:hypothetical protein
MQSAASAAAAVVAVPCSPAAVASNADLVNQLDTGLYPLCVNAVANVITINPAAAAVTAAAGQGQCLYCGAA